MSSEGLGHWKISNSWNRGEGKEEDVYIVLNVLLKHVYLNQTNRVRYD